MVSPLLCFLTYLPKPLTALDIQLHKIVSMFWPKYKSSMIGLSLMIALVLYITTVCACVVI